GTGIETGARIIASGTGVAAREIAAGVIAIVIVDDGLAETGGHTCAHQAPGVMVAEQRRDTLEQKRTAGDPSRGCRRRTQKAAATSAHASAHEASAPAPRLPSTDMRTPH